MRRIFHRYWLNTLLVVSVLAPGAQGAVVGFWEMEVDDNPAEPGISVPDSSPALGNPFTAGAASLAAPGAAGTANGVDGFNNVNGTVLSYPALNSASLTVSGYFRTNEATALLIGRTILPVPEVSPGKGYAIINPNDVTVMFYQQLDAPSFALSGGTGGLPGGPIDLYAGTIEAPAWTKITFSYNATTGVANLLANDVLRGTLTVPGGGPMFIEGDDIPLWVGNAAYPGGGLDGGDMAANTGGIIDQIQVMDTAMGTTPTFREGDFDESGIVAAPDLNRWKSNYGKATLATHMEGDANADGDVDGNDFLTWQSQLGLSSTVGAVPEPASGVLAVVVALPVVRRARRARASRE